MKKPCLLAVVDSSYINRIIILGNCFSSVVMSGHISRYHIIRVHLSLGEEPFSLYQTSECFGLGIVSKHHI